MKKIICGALVVFSALMFFGCKSSKTQDGFISSHLIESRNNIYVATDDNFYASFCSGTRESDYALDGKISSMVDFGIVTIGKVDNTELSATECEFTININGEETTGKLEKSPYDNTYSCDIEKMVDDNAEITLKFSADNKNFDATLYNESKNFSLSQNDAINVAEKELKTNIKSLSDVNGKTSEAFVKILKDYSGESNKYFWYVGIVSPDGKTFGILIDASNGEIVSKKV